MFDNLLIIAIVIILFWVAALAFYLITSRKQIDLEKRIQSLNEMLDQTNNQGD